MAAVKTNQAWYSLFYAESAVKPQPTNQ